MGPKSLVLTAAGCAAAILVAISAVAAEEAVPRGHEVFLEAKCNLCHGVPAAGIEAKTTSEKMKGPDLLAGEWDGGKLAGFIKQEIEVDGRKHKKEFKGSDEELQALVDWLLEQKAE